MVADELKACQVSGTTDCHVFSPVAKSMPDSAAADQFDSLSHFILAFQTLLSGIVQWTLYSHSGPAA